MAKKGIRKPKQRVLKQERKNLRLWAEGVRKEILELHLDAYSKALDKGWVQEHWRTADHEEPILRPFDPSAPITVVFRSIQELTDEEEADRGACIEELNKRIHHWFIYHIRRHRSLGLNPLKNPYALLLSQLSGVTTPPKARQAYQQFMHESYGNLIAPRVNTEWAAARERGDPETKKTKTPKAGFRSCVAQVLFNGLSSEEKAGLSQRAKDSAAEAKEKYLRALQDPPSNSPADHQRCIKAIPDFVAPILRGLEEHTGLHSVLIMGSPIPKYSGEIRTIHVSNGVNRTAAAQHWPQWNKERFNKQVLVFMVEYLHTAYTATDCAATTLSPEGDLDQAEYTIVDPEFDDNDLDDDSDDSDTISDSDDEAPAKKKHKPSANEPKNCGKRKRVQSELLSTPSIPLATPPQPEPSAPKETTTTMELGAVTVTFEDPTAGIPYEQLTYQQRVDRNRLRNQALGTLWRSDVDVPVKDSHSQCGWITSEKGSRS
ncbi:hypothetical protein K438DRAFT_1953855 [Mycena galopus ATCC 62051]|nr:hypothetical protein K438DRAFT_1953855 [Mycena galopus ATCC 62051]